MSVVSTSPKVPECQSAFLDYQEGKDVARPGLCLPALSKNRVLPILLSVVLVVSLSLIGWASLAFADDAGATDANPDTGLAEEAVDSAKADAAIASGTCGTCPWEISSDGTLSVYPGVLPSTHASLPDSCVLDGLHSSYYPWNKHVASIKKARFVQEGSKKVVADADISGLFGCFSKLESVDFSGLDTSNVTNMGWMFFKCPSLTSLDLSSFDTSNVTNMDIMFLECSSLSSLDVSSFNTSRVTKMGGMFNGCESLKSLDLSSFDTSNITIMGSMFLSCSSLESLDVSSFDTSNVTGMSTMFSGCRSLKSLDLSSFDTSKVAGMGGMFGGCSSLTSLDLSSFDTSSVTDMTTMFFNCSSLRTIIAGAQWSTEAVGFIQDYYQGPIYCGKDLFKGCTTLVGGNGTVFDSNHVDAEYARIDAPGTPGYLTKKSSQTDISKATIAAIASQTYTGKSITPKPKVSFNGTTLKEGTDYTLSYKNNVNAGTATVTITGKGNFTGTKAATFKIARAKVEKPTAKAGLAYTGKAQTGVVAASGYSISGGSATAAGSYTATATLDANHAWADGTTAAAKVAWSIAPAAISKATIAAITDQTYTGKAITPAPTVKIGSTTLKSGTDYTVSYKNNTNAGTATITVTGKGNFTGTKSVTFKIVKAATYTVSYNANGGTGAPSSQAKTANTTLKLSNAKPTKTYTVNYNANGGKVSPASKSVQCTFKNWNTAKDGKGTSYAPGANYTANASATLYAQWANPTIGALATPSRSGYSFAGWFTAASGGARVNTSSAVTGNMTLYAHWTDPYNMGDETYSFENYGDYDSPFGHCFGMSITSAGYHNGLIDIKRIGGTAETPLYSFGPTQRVKDPICFLQGVQGSRSARATVAGGSYYLRGSFDVASDWNAVLDYVKDHRFDNTGLLQIGFRKNGEGGHAVNFLRYENVNGQDRIYIYDNCFPKEETYLYRNARGQVLQAPQQTFSGALDCVALRDTRIYFKSIDDFDATHVVYMPKEFARVQGYAPMEMEADTELVMYEIPSSKDSITIVPKKDNATFIYMGKEYRFGKITDETRGLLKLATRGESGPNSDEVFTIYEDTDKGPIWKRLWGQTAYETMQAIAREGWQSSDTVVIATFDGYWDALSASALAGQSNAPILLTGQNELHKATAAEIQRLGARRAIIVGGPVAVSSSVENKIKAMGLAVERLWGDDAQQTAIAISSKVGGASGTCIIATSNGYWDALAASPLAYAKGYPIYLTDAAGVLQAETLAAIKAAGFKRAIIAGGTVAVAGRTESDLKGIGVGKVERKWGDTAVQTSRALAEFAIAEGMSANHMGVATLDGYWDALTGGAMLGKKGGVLVLSSDANTSNTAVVVGHATGIARAYILGGEQALNSKVFDAYDATTRNNNSGKASTAPKSGRKTTQL